MATSTDLRQNIALASNVAATLGILLIAGLWLKEVIFPPPGPLDPRAVADWEYYAKTGSGKTIGSEEAPVTVTVFSDFECPFCRSLSAEIATLRARFPSEVKIVFRHFPLPRHENARPAAIAAECAHKQGRFTSMHDALFAAQDTLARVSWAALGQVAGVPDSSRFAQCLVSEDVALAIDLDFTAGERLGVEATPTVLVGQWRIMGPADATAMGALVRKSLP
jgi:protein-disulfide isomerase